MSANRLCTAAEKDLEKFLKFLVLKSAQVVVQSRLGEKIQTQCNPHASGNDWFNIVIQDHPDVLYETKKALSINSGESITNRLPLCIEISLQTVDGDKMILEVWSLSLNTEQSDQQIRAAHAIYNRMGILLKSLISVTRATPAYKLSRLQNSDSYQIYYRIYVDEPQVHNLGEGYKQVRVGQLSTILGTLNMSVAYRTKMTISPTQTGRCDNAIMLKSDHFLKDLSPKQIRYHHIKKSEKKIIDIDKPLRPGAFVDTTKLKQFTEDDYILPETPPFSWLIRKTKEDSSQENSVEDNKTTNSNVPNEKVKDTDTIINNNKNSAKNYENSLQTNKDIQLTKLQKENQKNSVSGTSPIKSLLICKQEETKKSLITPNTTIKSLENSHCEDENLLKELNFPFASGNTHMGDLAKFYRDCYNAPPLHSYNESSTLEPDATIEDLSKQLEQFETSLHDYDSLVKSLGCSSLDSNLNS